MSNHLFNNYPYPRKELHSKPPSFLSNTVSTVKTGVTAYQAVQGNPIAQLSLAADAFNKVVETAKLSKMPKRTGYTKRRIQRRRRTHQNGYVKPIRIPVRVSIPWSATSGTTGKWNIHVNLNSLIKNFIKTYDEFKVLSLNVKWLPNNSTSSIGLTAAVLMDQNGFGDFGSASSNSWFDTLSSMPGSYVGNRHTNFSLPWRPTEPDARQWRSYQRSQTNYVVCSFYMADNNSTDVEVGGVILVSGTAQGRGMYYNASTIQRSFAEELILRTQSADQLCSSFEEVAVDQN